MQPHQDRQQPPAVYYPAPVQQQAPDHSTLLTCVVILLVLNLLLTGYVAVFVYRVMDEAGGRSLLDALFG